MRAVAKQQGVAILQVLILLTVLMAIAEGAALLARVEVRVAHFHRTERDAAYAAQAMLAATLQELERSDDWNAVLSGARVAPMADGPPDVPRQIPGGGTVNVCCGPGSLTARVRAETGDAWQLFAWQSLRALLDVPDAPRHYVVAWVQDDDDESDGEAMVDSNDRISVRVESVSALGARNTIEALVSRPPLDVAIGSRPPGVQLMVWRSVR